MAVVLARAPPRLGVPRVQPVSGNTEGRVVDTDEIEKLIAEFDFDRVHKAMVAVDWKWGGTFGPPPAVPAKDALIATARDLLRQVSAKGAGSISTGGFCAFYDAEHDEDTGALGLQFVLESA
jgi:hypothetical protein